MTYLIPLHLPVVGKDAELRRDYRLTRRGFIKRPQLKLNTYHYLLPRVFSPIRIYHRAYLETGRCPNEGLTDLFRGETPITV